MKPTCITPMAKALLSVLCAASLWQADAAPKTPARPPNIVIILADDLGIHDLGCYGRKEHRTPNLDQLATEGVRLLSAYCASPLCSPSRAALLTGKHPARLHLTTYLPGRPDARSQRLLQPRIRQQLPLEETTLAETLRRAGYATACIGKWHLGGKGFGPAEQGFDYVFAGQANTTPGATEGGKGESELTSRAEEFITTNRARPFFLYLAHNNPHIPLAAQPDLVSKSREAFNPVYAAMIETLDQSVGRVLARLEQLELRTKTIVVFTSDNGGLHVLESPESPSTHNTPFRAGKGFVYEGGLRVPMIVRLPGHVPDHCVTDRPVVNWDIMPTLLELAGITPPAGLDGVSVAGMLTTGAEPPARPLFWHFPHYSNQGGRPGGSVRIGDWKLAEHYEDGRVELFNLTQDPGETTDLAGREPTRAKEMRDQLAAWRKSVGAQENSPNPDFDPAWHKRLYEEVDVSRLAPASKATELAERLAPWRRDMNDVLKPAQ